MDFSFYPRTKIIFGRDAELNAGQEAKAYGKKALLHYGGGSAVKSGLVARVSDSLQAAGLEVFTLGGAQPNPRLSLVREGIGLCREKGIDVILAVGGGSALDSAKAMSTGLKYDGDVWDFFCGNAVPQDALPLGVVPTLPAAGSEGSNSCVITNEDGWFKRGSMSDANRPLFALLNPELTYSLPAYQTACGAADMLGHIIERYFTNTKDVMFTDELCEGVMRTIIANAPVCLKSPNDYAARSEIMLCGWIAHNNMLGIGREQDWASHQMEHELSAAYDVAHGAGLAVLYPWWLKHVAKQDYARGAQFANRVFGVPVDFHDLKKTAFEGFDKLSGFFVSLGLPATLRGLGISGERLEEMAGKCKRTNPDGTVGLFMRLSTQDILDIYRAAL